MKKGWEYKTLGECCEILDRFRKPIKQSKRESGRIPYYGATGLLDYVNDYIFDDTLVLLGEDGAKWGAGDDSAFIISGKTWVNNHAHVLKPFSFLNERYLVYYFKKSDLTEYITGVTVPKLNQERMRHIIIPIPDLDEQRRIVSYLDSSFDLIDKIKENASKSLSEAKALFQSALAEAMEPKEGWEEKTLGEVAIFRNGIAHEKSIDKEKGIYVVINSKFVSTEGRIKKFCNSQMCPLKKGEIVMVMSDVPNGKTLAKCFIIDENNRYTLNQRICAFSNHKIDTHYLYYFINRNKYFLEFDNGENQTNLRKNDILNCPVYFPNLKTQKQIVSRLDSLSSKVRAIEEKYQKMIAECDAMKQAMLREVFE